MADRFYSLEMLIRRAHRCGAIGTFDAADLLLGLAHEENQ